MKTIQLAFISLFCLSMVACTKGLSDEQNDKLSQLQIRLDSTLNLLESIDTAKSNASYKHFFENINYIQNEISDTIPTEMAMFLDDYYSLRKAFLMFGREYSDIINEFMITKKQLTDLKHDGDAGILEEGQFEKYYHLEANNLVLAEEKANEVLYAIETIQPMYDKMNPEIDSVLAIYKSKATAE